MKPEELYKFATRLVRAGYSAEIHIYNKKLPKLKVRRRYDVEPTQLIPSFKRRAYA